VKYLYVGVVGSRGYNSFNEMIEILDQTITASRDATGYDNASPVIVSGGAAGADRMAEQYAKIKKYQYVEIPAMWAQHGKKAGLLRNPIIVDISNVVVAFWDGNSRGTMNSIQLAQAADKALVVHNYTTNETRAY
jgi:hypothetical protein